MMSTARADGQPLRIETLSQTKLPDMEPIPLPPPLDFVDILRDFTPSEHEIYLASTLQGALTSCTSKLFHIGLGGKTGAGKCLEENEPIFLADGQIVPAKSLIGCTTDIIGVTDTNTMTQIPVKATFTDNGRRNIIEIELDNGIILKRTEEHPLWAAKLNHLQDVGLYRKNKDGRTRKDKRTRATTAEWVRASDIDTCGNRPNFAGHVILCPLTINQQGTKYPRS